MKNSFKSGRLILAISMLLVWSACTTTKNTPLHRGWHNMNARYNGYFYGRENNKEATKRVEKEHVDDFSQLIPLFIYPTNETAKNYTTDFDKTIKKSSTVIHRHAITHPKSKEEIANACRWIDENYMLIGKAHLYKRELIPALEVFTYVAQKYPNPAAKYNGLFWVIRTNNEIGSLSLSEPIIDEIRNAEDFPKKRREHRKYFQREFAAVTTDYYLRKLDYPTAIKHLTDLIAITKKKSVKARYVYLLAQLYEKVGDNQNASLYYTQVTRLHPAYPMEFSAKMKQAQMYDAQTGDSKEIKKQLLKMSNDSKNTEYLDQIYYALAQIAHKENDAPLALEYLDKSILNSVNNPTQKALAFLKRADIYFEKTNYPSAESNYDSAMVLLPKDYPDYKLIEAKKISLTALVTNLNVITLEDSLQALSKMSDKERSKAVEKMIAKMEEDEKRKEELRQQQLNNQLLNAQNPIAVPGGQLAASGAWYFYNDATVGFGIGEFVKKWGDRKLEDNWRRAQKEQGMSVMTDDQSATADSVASGSTAAANTNVAAGTTNIKDKTYYMSSIPATADAIDKSNNRIIDAYYNIGVIYKEQLQNNQKSVEAMEELFRRFPDNKYKQTAHYQMYRTYLAMNNSSKAEYYKNSILTNFPDSEYAKLIKNPDYGKEVLTSKSLIEQFYAETYQLYTEGKYLETIANCAKADTAYTKNYLMPQFDLLRAFSIGKTQDKQALEASLVKITIKYPKSPVKEKAQNILDAMKNQKIVMADTTKQTDLPKIPSDTSKSTYSFKEEGVYYWVFVLEVGKGDVERIKTKITDINTKSFAQQNLAVSISPFDNKRQQLIVQKLMGKTQALEYFNHVNQTNNIYVGLETGAFEHFVISEENYTALMNKKDIKEYLQFFIQNFK